ncbi:MAG: hypothetical protein IT258_04675 [Saprospiraceae bacterium]|nr:hypothetical protein [Saprospiraceae bacterium]
MSTVTVRYVRYVPGRRRPRSGGFVSINPDVVSTSSAGSTISVFVPDTLEHEGTNLPFAFTSVVGAANGNQVYTTPNDQTVVVGEGNINVLVVYATIGSGGDGGPQTWVDAFNVNTGALMDDDFVQVFVRGALDSGDTSNANLNGAVASNSDKTLTAFDSVAGQPFFEWNKVGSSSPVVSRSYELSKGESGFLFAFFKRKDGRPIPGDILPSYPPESYTWVSPGVKVDAGGIGFGPNGPFPIDPWGPLNAKLMSAFVLVSVASNFNEKMRAKTHELAASYLRDMANEIGNLAQLDKGKG